MAEGAAGLNHSGLSLDLTQKTARAREIAAELRTSGTIGPIEILPGAHDISEVAVSDRLRPALAALGGLRGGGIALYTPVEIQSEFETRLENLEDGEDELVPMEWKEIGYITGGHLLFCDDDSGAVGSVQEEMHSSEHVEPLVPTLIAGDPFEFFTEYLFGSGYLDLGRIGWGDESLTWLDQDWLTLLRRCGFVED